MNDQPEKNVPGVCNTPVQNTCPTGQRSLVDWFSSTFSVGGVPPHEILKLIGLDSSDFDDTFGLQGYSKGLIYNGIKLYYKEENEMFFYWLDISGTGCRFYETITDFTWFDLFDTMRSLKASITRLDLAVDDFDGIIKLTKLNYYTENDMIRTRFESYREFKKKNIQTKQLLGHTLYYGSEQSNIQIRFYDKKLERENKAKKQVTVNHWVRCEMQLRNERADQAVNHIINGRDVGYISKAILLNYIKFVTKGNDTNKARWKLAKWYDDFLGKVEPLKLSVKAPDATIEKTIQWVSNQVAPALTAIVKAMNDDKTIIDDFLLQGEERLSKKHKMMIDQYKKNHPQMNVDDDVKPEDFLN